MAKALFEVSTPITHTSIDALATTPVLPHEAAASTAAASTDRAAQLADAKNEYQFDWNTANATGVPLLKSLPMREFFSIRYVAKSAEALAKIKLNEVLPPLHREKDRAERLGDYADLFVILTEPAVAQRHLWATDTSFGEQRLSGANPMSIRRVADAAAITALVPPDVERLLGGAKVAHEVAAGRLFVVDHRDALTPITQGETVELSGETFEKFVPKSAALFWWNRWTRRLMPISILVDGPAPQLFAANGNTDAWLRAKIAFQACDGVVHEMSAHLGRTHLVMEGIAISAKRQLAEAHPITRLLLPHLRFMLSLNQFAERTLIAPGSDLAVSFGAPISEVVGVAAQAYRTWDFTQHAFPNDIANRGVSKSDGLPCYAYRDDAALYWNAISHYVAEYVELYYGNDAAVASDPELAAWSAEVSAPAPAGAAIQGFPALETVEQLVFALTHIVFVCSVQHSAVNYPQDDYLAFAPNSPFGIWAPLADQNVLDLLPPMGPAEGQISMLFQLTAFHYDRLGDYAGKYTRDERANAVIRRFFGGMDAIDAAITAHERDRWQSYEYLRPKNVLNSISI